MLTLADTFLAESYEGADFTVGKDPDSAQWRVTMPGAFGPLVLAEANDTGTLLGELITTIEGAQAILAQSDPEPDPVNIGWAFMAWLNGNRGATVHLGSRLKITNPDRGTRRALGGMNIAIEGQHFRFNTDAFNGLHFVRTFAGTIARAATKAMEWIDAAAAYRMEVPEALLAQANKIEVYSNDTRACFGVEITGNAFAPCRQAVLDAVAEWGWLGSNQPGEQADSAFVIVFAVTSNLSKLLGALGNALAAHPESTLRIFDMAEARERQLRTGGL